MEHVATETPDSYNRRNTTGWMWQALTSIFATTFCIVLILELDPAWAHAPSQRGDLIKGITGGILDCLSHGGDAVLLHRGVQCEPYFAFTRRWDRFCQ
jgi:hypothetical protein